MSFPILIGDTIYPRDFLSDKASQPGQALLRRARLDKTKIYCMCIDGGPGLPLYIRKEKNGFVLVKFRGQGPSHHPECPSVLQYESHTTPKPAISQNDEGFRLRISITSLNAAKPIAPSLKDPEEQKVESVASSSLSHRDLMRFIMREIGYSEWNPAFEGKRDWTRFSYRVAQLAGRCDIGHGLKLSDILVVPEHREVKTPAWFAQSASVLDRIYEINHTTGYAAILLDQLVQIGDPKHSYPLRFQHLKYAGWLDKTKAAQIVHSASYMASMLASGNGLVLGMFEAKLSADRYLNLVNGALLTLNQQWIPCADRFEGMALNRLVNEKRIFKLADQVKPFDPMSPIAQLLDMGEEPFPIYLVGGNHHGISSSKGLVLDGRDPDSPLALPNPVRKSLHE
jgi:hypothetical protein